MLSLLVPAQVHFPLECPAADVAGERLEAGVFATVGDEVGGLAESLAADCAFVRFLTWKIKWKLEG